MGIMRKNSVRIARRKSFSGLSMVSTGVDAEGLENFLRYTVCTYSHDAELSSVASAESVGLSHRLQTLGSDGCADELSNVLEMLSSFLSVSATPTVPSSVVYQVHFLAGQIRESRMNYEGAARSYHKALWVASSSEELRNEQLALTLHRLGKVYGKMGNYLQARQLLNNAIATYERSHVHRDHPCVIDAKHAGKYNESKYWANDNSWSSLRSDRRLALIAEEPTSRSV